MQDMTIIDEKAQRWERNEIPYNGCKCVVESGTLRTSTKYDGDMFMCLRNTYPRRIFPTWC